MDSLLKVSFKAHHQLSIALFEHVDGLSDIVIKVSNQLSVELLELILCDNFEMARSLVH